MKRTIIIAGLLLAAGLSIGCSRGKDEVLADGTKWFGERILRDGTKKAVRVEFPDGQKDYDETTSADGTRTIARVEFPDGRKFFNEAFVKDGTRRIDRIEWPTGEKWFDVTFPPDGTKKIGRAEFPNGEKHFEVMVLADGWAKASRVQFPDGTQQSDVSIVPDGHLEFRGLHAGQSRAEVEAILKKQYEDVSLDCDPPKNGVSCQGSGKQLTVENLHFSREDKLYHFKLNLHGPKWLTGGEGDNPDDFFPALRGELASTNHKEGTAETVADGDALGQMVANQGVRTFTWGTDRTVVCMWDQEKDDCPAEKIELAEYHQNCCSAEVEFTDNAYETDGWAKKDKNRPKPKVTVAMRFLGLEGGESRGQVAAALQRLHYQPLACKHESGSSELECTTKSQDHQFELVDFVHDRLSSLRFRYPANEHDELYQTFVKSFGEPTDFAGKKGSELFTWNSERTVPCATDEQKQCTAIALMLSPPDEGEPNGTVLFLYTPLVNVAIKESAQRMMNAAHRY